MLEVTIAMAPTLAPKQSPPVRHFRPDPVVHFGPHPAVSAGRAPAARRGGAAGSPDGNLLRITEPCGVLYDGARGHPPVGTRPCGVGSCWSDFEAVIATAGFRVINSGWRVVPHLLFVNPYLGPGRPNTSGRYGSGCEAEGMACRAGEVSVSRGRRATVVVQNQD